MLKRTVVIALLLNLYLTQGMVSFYLNKLHGYLPVSLQFLGGNAPNLDKASGISITNNNNDNKSCDVRPD